MTAWNQILKENENETGRQLLTDQLHSADMSMLKQAESLRLVGLYYLILYKDNYAFEIAKEINLKINEFGLEALATVKTKLLQITTKENIKRIQDASIVKTKNESFENLIAQAEQILGRNLNLDLTVRMWNSYSKTINEIIKARNGKS